MGPARAPLHWPMPRAELTAYVLGGGGVLGSSEVGMVRALAEHGIRPDLVLGTSIGALNGAFIAADPGLEGAERLAAVWEAVVREGVFLDNPVRQAARVASYRTHLLSNAPLRHLLTRYLPVASFEELEVPFQCVAACIEDSSGRWFSEGDLADPSWPRARCPASSRGAHRRRHYLDGGPRTHPRRPCAGPRCDARSSCSRSAGSS